MDPAQLARVAEGVGRGEYSLLLGAGASIGALGGNAEPLPSGPMLRDRLVSDFSIPTEGQTIALPRAYAAARRNDPERLEQYIRSQFTHCKPDWQNILSNFDWHRIWTLNIDDIVENVYRSRNISFDQFNWTSKFRDGSKSERQIIHLHGFAKDSSDSDPEDSELVFSIQEYAATLKDTRAWHTVFTDEFSERPFIVLGASLVEEFDLQHALSSSAASTTRGFPSIIVLKEVTSLERDELMELGLIVVETEAKSFMTDLQIEVQNFRKQLAGLYGQFFDPKVARFLQQFIDLRQYQPNRDARTRNFYAGYEPQWRNILDEDDALLETTENSLSTIRSIASQEKYAQSIHVLSGASGTGKSTGLLRVASQFIADGRPTFQFRGEEDLDVDATIQWLERMQETVLIFDGCADFADSIGDLAEACESSSIRLLAVGAERTRRQRIIEQKIANRFLHLSPVYEYRLLSDKDIDSLVDKLSLRRRLGRITRRNRPHQLNYFRSFASRRLFEGMANLEGGRGFQARIRENYRLVSDESVKRLYAACSVAYELGYPVPLGISSKIAGLTSTQLEASLVSDEQEIMLIDRNGVRPPHRITAGMIVESALSRDERFNAMRSLMLALAPHIDITAIVNLTRPYRLLRRLMDQESIMRLVGSDLGRILYEVIQDAYDWNGRYWDQRALFESELGNHAQARSYAEHSLKTHHHPFALNTLGTVLGRMAVQDGDIEVLREAIRNLEYARDHRRWDASEHPYVTFFSTMVRFGQEWGLAAIPTQLRSAFTEWVNQASRSIVFSNASTQQQLRTFQRDWLSLAVQ